MLLGAAVHIMQLQLRVDAREQILSQREDGCVIDEIL